MALRAPESMDELVYFTRRGLQPKGSVVAWVRRQPCPKCRKALMGKPIAKGRVKTRAQEYVCPACGHTVDRASFEAALACEATYDCPHCGKPGESTAPFMRKKVEGVPTIQVLCQHCKGKINITRKLKAGKKKRDIDDEDF